MGKIFADQKITCEGKVLSFGECKLFFDYQYTSFDPEKAEAIIKSAEAIVDEDIPFLPLSLYRDFWKTGNRSGYQTPDHKRRNNYFILTLAEMCEKKGRFIEKIVDYIWAIMEQTSWVIPAHAGHTPTNNGSDVPTVYLESDIHGIDLYSAATAAALTTALVYLKDEIEAISPRITERMEYEIKKRTIKPFLSVVFRWSGEFGSRPNNWCPWIVSNVLYVTALLEEDDILRRQVVARAMKYVDNYIGGQPEDGGCDEGPGYWGAAGAALFDCIELIYDMTGGAINVFDYPQLRKIGEYEPFANIHDNRYVNFGDTSSRMYPDGYMIMRFGERTGSDSLYAFGKSIAPKYHDYAGSRHVYRTLKNLMMPMQKEVIETKSPTRGYLPDLKLMIARESEDTSKGMYVACKGGHNKQSHNHNDMGQFIVYYDGEPVVIDPGACTYTRDTFGSKRYTIWGMQSHYHNVPAFGGVGQKNGIQYASTREVYDDVTGKISYGLEKAYPAEANLALYTRSCELKDGVVIITDDVHQACEQEIDFRMMLHREPTVIEEGKIQLTGGRVLEYDTRLALEIEVFNPVGMDVKKAWESEHLYRLHFRVTEKDFTCEFRIK